MTAIDYSYDGSYLGLMTVIFEIYASKQLPRTIVVADRAPADLFAHYQFIATREDHAYRVLQALKKKMTPTGLHNLYKALLSERSGIEVHIYRTVKYALATALNIESDFRKPYVLAIKQWARKVDREVHRMHAFVRFQKTKDGIYAATIAPDFNVIPLIGSHFEKRYADQRWMIYDVRRDVGLYYNLKTTHIIRLEEANFTSDRKIDPNSLEQGEREMEQLWKTYFEATTIKERRNMKLHLQHVPRRYWKFLPEKK